MGIDHIKEIGGPGYPRVNEIDVDVVVHIVVVVRLVARGRGDMMGDYIGPIVRGRKGV